jgi:hypothetical protein
VKVLAAHYQRDQANILKQLISQSKLSPRGKADLAQMVMLMKQHEAMLIQSVGCSSDIKDFNPLDSGIIMNHYKRINGLQGYSPICGLGIYSDTARHLDISKINTTASTSVATRTPPTKP